MTTTSARWVRRSAAVLWLTTVWVLLWGTVSVANVLGGLVVAVVVTALLPMPPIEFNGRVHLGALVHLVLRFVKDLVVASAQVTAVAMRPGRMPRGAVIAVQLRSHSDLYLTLTATLCSLVPGSIVVEAHRLTGRLYVHVLDVDESGIEAARQDVLDIEARVLRALASDAELEQAGVGRRGGRADLLRRGTPALRPGAEGRDVRGSGR